MADAGVIELVDTLQAMDFTPSCEHVGHGMDSHNHEGQAAWIQYSPCACPASTGKPVCDRWRRYIIANPKRDFLCTQCGDVGPGSTMTFIKL